MCLRADHAGVTSIVRALNLTPSGYGPLLHLFKSSDWSAASLTEVESYNRFVAIGLAAQGFMQYLSSYFPGEVYALSPWLRTQTKSGHPSEQTVLNALKAALPEFLASTPDTSALKKILTKNQVAKQQSSTSKAA